MAVGDGALARIGGDHGRGQHLGKRRELVAGLRVMHALAGPQHRILGREQHFDGLFDCVGIGRAPLHRYRRIVERALEFRFRDFLRQFDQHRAGLAGAHGVIGAPQQVG